MPDRNPELSSSRGGVVHEIVTRGGQEVRKWLERTGAAHPGGPPLPASVPRRSVAEAVRPPASFPWATEAEASGLFERRFPGIGARTAAEADKICAGRFDLLGHRGLSFGAPIDWRRDPLSGRRTPLTHWSRIHPDDADAVGDVKLVWELNRHGFMVTLGRAYRLTGDERYAEAASTLWREWTRANPPGIGINWTSSLEVAIRMIAWCWSIGLLAGSRALDDALRSDIIEGIRAHATHIERYLSYYHSPNTHLTGEALGLAYAGTLFPALKLARRWRELGTSILVNESVRQVSADGVYFEQSTGYQRYTVEIYLHLFALSRISGDVIPSSVGTTVERMVDALIALRSPSGEMPQIGDDDGGCIVALERREPADPRGLFSAASAIFRREDFAWAAGGAAPEAAWLLGREGLDRIAALGTAPPGHPPSRAFERGGYVVMRSGWDRRAHQLIFDVGPLGGEPTAGHGHADLLSVQCSAFGEPYLVDPGTYCYGSSRTMRDHFRGTAAHSTVLVDGRGQASPDGTFAWKSRPVATLSGWRSDEAGDFADASHDAYASLPGGVTHRRRILFVRRRYWVIVDDLSGADRHDVQLRFQFAPLPVVLGRVPWVVASHPDGHGMLVGAYASRGMRPRLCAGRDAPITGWVSPHFGRCRPAPLAVWSTSARLPQRIVTLLLPVERAATRPPLVRPTVLPDGRICALQLGDGGDELFIDDREVALAPPRSSACAAS
jgi:hypothetical protein